jgi:hypothetical protein
MALIFDESKPMIPELSYLVDDDSDGGAAVFDLRRNGDCHRQLAREKQVSINVVMVKHAGCVTQCAIAFAELGLDAGAPALGIQEFVNKKLVRTSSIDAPA